MRLTERIAVELENTYAGPAWHGTALRPMIADVDEATAQARPIANARTIAELTAHAGAWISFVERRLRDELFEVTPEVDFPPGDAMPFTELRAQLDRDHATLLATLRAMPDDALDDVVPGKPYTKWTMLAGLAHHNTYHAAQIAMLRKFGSPG